jgi:SAM-dependent methyltransferase
MYPWPERITAVSDVPLTRFAELFPMIRSVTADGRQLPFDDNAFDIAFSNAVIEHVGGRDDQRRFVHELCRVARRVFISTPNRWFPVETHTLLPFVHWLPLEARNAVFRAVGKGGWADVNLLSSRQLVALFPEPARVRIVESRITVTAVTPT